MIESTCCFLGHREIAQTPELRQRLYSLVKWLIEEKQVNIFLFGSKSQFNTLCYETVSQLKEKYPHIKRIYVRAEFPVIDDGYTAYLLERYEETYYPLNVHPGRAAYVERNRHMIDQSAVCVVYYTGLLGKRKSGTALALDYAVKKNREIYRLENTC